MARGALVKQQITETLLKTFQGSFLYNGGKEIRIPMKENGELIQVKVTLTAAKVNVEPDEDVAVPGEVIKAAETAMPEPETSGRIEPTPEEKKNVANLMKELGLA